MVLIGLEEGLWVIKYRWGLAGLRSICIPRSTTRMASWFGFLRKPGFSFRTGEIWGILHVFFFLSWILSAFIFILLFIFHVIENELNLISLFGTWLFLTLSNFLIEIPISDTCLSSISIEGERLLLIYVIWVRGLIVCIDLHWLLCVWFYVFWAF